MRARMFAVGFALVMIYVVGRFVLALIDGSLR